MSRKIIMMKRRMDPTIQVKDFPPSLEMSTGTRILIPKEIAGKSLFRLQRDKKSKWLESWNPMTIVSFNLLGERDTLWHRENSLSRVRCCTQYSSW